VYVFSQLLNIGGSAVPSCAPSRLSSTSSKFHISRFLTHDLVVLNIVFEQISFFTLISVVAVMFVTILNVYYRCLWLIVLGQVCQSYLLMLMLIKVCVSETRLTDYKRERLGGKDKFKKCVLSRRRN
jgi:hypothetical protein